jgi:SAM-dependent methyltransferase
VSERHDPASSSPADGDERRSVAYYDRIAPSYDTQLEGDARNGAMRNAFRTRVSTLAKSGGTILDFGCGTGADALWYAERGHRVVAYDVSAGMVEMLRARAAAALAQGRIVAVAGTLGDLEATLVAHAPVAAVAANFAVLNHFADLAPVLRYLAARLRPDGAVVASFLNPVREGDMRQSWWWRGLPASLSSGAITFRGDVTTHRHFVRTIRRAAEPDLIVTDVAHVDAAGTWSSERLGWRAAMQEPFVFVVLRRSG